MRRFIDPADGSVTLQAFWPEQLDVSQMVIQYDKPVKALALDTETEGLEPLTNQVVEISLRPFVFDPTTGDVASHSSNVYHGLQDPGAPLSDEIKKITHLTDEDLKGQQIDWQRVFDEVCNADLIVAHNASFDRRFVETSIYRWDKTKSQDPKFQHKLWGCSLHGIDWSDLEPPSKALQVLCWMHGFRPVSAHRASDDTAMLLHLLHVSQRLPELWLNANLPACEVWAVGSPYDSKDQLSARGYRWFKERKCWMRIVLVPDAQDELSWLLQQYGNQPFTARVERLAAWQRYK